MIFLLSMVIVKPTLLMDFYSHQQVYVGRYDPPGGKLPEQFCALFFYAEQRNTIRPT